MLDDDTIELDATQNMPEYVSGKSATADDFQSMFLSATTQGEGLTGRPKLKRRQIKFVVPGTVGVLRNDGLPVFSDDDGNIFDIEVVMHTLTSAEELEIFKKNSDNPILVIKDQIFKSIHRVCGAPVTLDRKEWFWEALSPAGRALLIVAHQKISSASSSELGKLQSTLQLE